MRSIDLCSINSLNALLCHWVQWPIACSASLLKTRRAHCIVGLSRTSVYDSYVLVLKSSEWFCVASDPSSCQASHIVALTAHYTLRTIPACSSEMLGGCSSGYYCYGVVELCTKKRKCECEGHFIVLDNVCMYCMLVLRIRDYDMCLVVYIDALHG